MTVFLQNKVFRYWYNSLTTKSYSFNSRDLLMITDLLEKSFWRKFIVFNPLIIVSINISEVNKQYVFIADIASWFGIDQKCINHWASKKKKKLTFLLIFSRFWESQNSTKPGNGRSSRRSWCELSGWDSMTVREGKITTNYKELSFILFNFFEESI